MKNYEHYIESKKIWNAWRKRQDEDPIIGFIMWEVYDVLFKLECWIGPDGLPIIFQFWPDGKGFQTYQILDKKQKMADDMFKALEEIAEYINTAEGQIAIEAIKKAEGK